MAGQFKTIISTFNKLEHPDFTSHILKENCAIDENVNPTTVSAFINTAFRMGIITKSPITNPIGRGPRMMYTKVRNVTGDETYKLTNSPDCVHFKREIDKAYNARIKPPVSPPVKVKQKDGVVNVRAYSRKKPGKENIAIKDHGDRTVITIFK